jgi:hypothetical protein
MAYYFELLELIENLEGKKIRGKELQQIYFKKYKQGSAMNINRVLKQLRKRKDIVCEKVGVDYFYSFKK